MAGLEQRITGGNPHAKAAERLATRDGGNTVFPLENPRMRITEAYPRLFAPISSVRFDPFNGKLHLATYVRHRKDPEVTVKRWSAFDGLEELTGMATEMFTQFDPEKGRLVQGTRQLIDFATEKEAAFRTREVNDTELADFLASAQELLKTNGFTKPILPLKDRIAKQIRAAMGPDSLHRRNPMIARTRLLSSIVSLCMMEQTQDRTAKKYLELFAYLIPEYQLERALVAQIIDELRDDHSELPTLRTMGDDLSSPVRSAPFRGPAMQAYHGIFSNGRKSTDYRFFEGQAALLRRVQTRPIAEYKRQLLANLERSLIDGSNIYTDPSV